MITHNRLVLASLMSQNFSCRRHSIYRDEDILNNVKLLIEHAKKGLGFDWFTYLLRDDTHHFVQEHEMVFRNCTS